MLVDKMHCAGSVGQVTGTTGPKYHGFGSVPMHWTTTDVIAISEEADTRRDDMDADMTDLSFYSDIIEPKALSHGSLVFYKSLNSVKN